MRESRFGMLRGNIGVARLPMLNGFIKGPALFLWHLVAAHLAGITGLRP